MNIYTKQISQLLKISLEEALKVQRIMEEEGLDFSECSTRTFNKEARLAYEVLKFVQ
jgi:Txe/YoeB family toxin of Txe-Axe toxin-antitoxin module